MSTAAKSRIPALMPMSSSYGHAFLLPVLALNTDAKLQALEALTDNEYRKKASSNNHTTRIALIAAARAMDEESRQFFDFCRDGGLLLFTWRGSRALVDALPASLQGSAA